MFSRSTAPFPGVLRIVEALWDKDPPEASLKCWCQWSNHPKKKVLTINWYLMGFNGDLLGSNGDLYGDWMVVWWDSWDLTRNREFAIDPLVCPTWVCLNMWNRPWVIIIRNWYDRYLTLLNHQTWWSWYWVFSVWSYGWYDIFWFHWTMKSRNLTIKHGLCLWFVGEINLVNEWTPCNPTIMVVNS